MTKQIIVLGTRQLKRDGSGRPWSERADAINRIKQRGGKVEADNGGRLLVVDADDDVDSLMKTLPAGSKILQPGDDVVAAMGAMKAEERIFAEALQVRFSRAFIKQKQTRKVGASLEEQEVFSRTCSTPPGEE